MNLNDDEVSPAIIQRFAAWFQDKRSDELFDFGPIVCD